MKLIEKSNSKRYSAVILYKDDLKNICDFLLSKSNKLTLNDSQYRYDNFDDFIHNYKGDCDLEFSIYDFSEKRVNVQLKISKYSASLNTVGSDSEIGAHVFIYLDRILSENVKKKYFFLSTPTTFIYTLLGFYVMFDPFNFLHFEKTIKGLTGFACILLGNISGRYALPTSKIILSRKQDHKNIFQRTKDDIFSNVAASLITAIIGFIAGVMAVKLGIIPASK
ncbi:hypothetical protein [Mucilaginibacter ginsenosidivorax]|uniref:Uncharacterized protein n=1 Tax=Mucilaginibacter ginsenosidivorax TaxID=862126 RepID=A0A5B8VZD9_9SPHI|nr:hypothetical protein [Mucilaginibacter ginsenosidivorax]QEC76869.1 hypothetical protein FSB76_13275 [Mucilaginibacter ginsenosidivorax]